MADLPPLTDSLIVTVHTLDGGVLYGPEKVPGRCKVGEFHRRLARPEKRAVWILSSGDAVLYDFTQRLGVVAGSVQGSSAAAVDSDCHSSLVLSAVADGSFYGRMHWAVGTGDDACLTALFKDALRSSRHFGKDACLSEAPEEHVFWHASLARDYHEYVRVRSGSEAAAAAFRKACSKAHVFLHANLAYAAVNPIQWSFALNAAGFTCEVLGDVDTAKNVVKASFKAAVQGLDSVIEEDSHPGVVRQLQMIADNVATYWRQLEMPKSLLA